MDSIRVKEHFAVTSKRGAYGSVYIGDGFATKYVDLTSKHGGNSTRREIKRSLNIESSIFREIIVLRELNRHHVPGIQRILSIPLSPLQNDTNKIGQLFYTTEDYGTSIHQWTYDAPSFKNRCDCLIEILYRVLLTMTELEKYEILHGDLSLGNILLDFSNYNEKTNVGPIKTTIIDFGASVLDISKPNDYNTCTKYFSSPEMMNMDLFKFKITTKHDLHSLCMVVIFAISIISLEFKSREDLQKIGFDFISFFNNQEIDWKSYKNLKDVNKGYLTNDKLSSCIPLIVIDFIRNTIASNPDERKTARECLDEMSPVHIDVDENGNVNVTLFESENKEMKENESGESNKSPIDFFTSRFESENIQSVVNEAIIERANINPEKLERLKVNITPFKLYIDCICREIKCQYMSYSAKILFESYIHESNEKSKFVNQKSISINSETQDDSIFECICEEDFNKSSDKYMFSSRGIRYHNLNPLLKIAYCCILFTHLMYNQDMLIYQDNSVSQEEYENDCLEIADTLVRMCRFRGFYRRQQES